jgi:hypothetical protein
VRGVRENRSKSGDIAGRNFSRRGNAVAYEAKRWHCPARTCTLELQGLSRDKKNVSG